MPGKEHTTNPGLSNQILVQIEIVKGKLYCYPNRATETLIYNCWDLQNSPPQGRPREVRWVVTGLEQGQYVSIEPKDPVHGQEMFEPQFPFVVHFGFDSITTGIPKKRAGKGNSLPWSYKITLYDPKAPQPVVLDPDVVIKDYP